jgi:hypothetical protein
MLSAGFEPAIPAMKQPQTYALDCTATGIGSMEKLSVEIIIIDGNFENFLPNLKVER